MPNSVLWVGLVAIWLFVLVPMFIKGRPEVAKTTEAVRRTRLLHRGGAVRAKSRSRIASGAHPHDASYKRTVKAAMSAKAAAAADAKAAEADSSSDDADAESVGAVAYEEKTVEMKKVAPVTVDAELVEDDAAEDVVAEDDSIVDAEYDDSSEDVTEVIDVVGEDSDAEYDDDLDEDAEYNDELDEDAEYVDELDENAEYDDDLDGDAEYDDYDDDLETVAAQDHDDVESEQEQGSRPRGRGGYNPELDQSRGDVRYRERQRVLIGLLALTLLAVGAGVLFGMIGWIATGVAVVALTAYLAYLRRAVRTEAQIRKQRTARLEKSRREADARRRREIAEPELAERIPRRLRRPGSVVLEIDDDDPIFEHLPPFQRRRVMREDEDFRRVG
ncbi:gephyrin-like molybdotransferase receptor GlpR [Gordonia sp. CPCC 205333]|uniref:divisome protein SepX/GlpR n=1 Tax=Gordonia sp. CPCC 205333 TaxID=3140790 RepID=UPI003AF3A92A